MGMTRARKQEEIEDLKGRMGDAEIIVLTQNCLLYTSPSPRDRG